MCVGSCTRLPWRLSYSIYRKIMKRIPWLGKIVEGQNPWLHGTDGAAAFQAGKTYAQLHSTQPPNEMQTEIFPTIPRCYKPQYFLQGRKWATHHAWKFVFDFTRRRSHAASAYKKWKIWKPLSMLQMTDCCSLHWKNFLHKLKLITRNSAWEKQILSLTFTAKIIGRDFHNNYCEEVFDAPLCEAFSFTASLARFHAFSYVAEDH